VCNERFNIDSDMTKQPDKQSADTDDTMQARPSDEPETVVVDSHTISVDRAALAWTLEDEAADKPQRRSWPRTVGLATGIEEASTLRGETHSLLSIAQPGTDPFRLHLGTIAPPYCPPASTLTNLLRRLGNHCAAH